MIEDQKRRKESGKAQQEKEYAALLTQGATKVHEDAFSLLRDVLARKQVLCGKNELCDFAAFMGKDALEAMDITTLYLGEDEELTGMDKSAALDRMLKSVLSFTPEVIQDCSDKELSENALELESIAWRVAAFDNLSEKYQYFEDMDPGKKKQIAGKLSKLRKMANYYLIRKKTITDPEYKSDSDEESESEEMSKLSSKQMLQKNFDRTETEKIAEEMIGERGKHEGR